MKWLKDLFADAKAIVLAPITNIICVSGLALICISFLDYDKSNGLALHGQLHATPAIAGFVLVIVGVVLFYLTNGNKTKNVRLDYNKGVEINRLNLKIRIKSGEIQSIDSANRNSAIVLPANTTFVDDCAIDNRTALGAFFLNRFPEKTAVLPTLFTNILEAQGLLPDESGQFPAGTTIILPDDFAKPAKIVVTASTTRLSGTGITSNPYVICNCVEGILKCTADQRVDTIYLPILGSGHGGVDRGMALLFLLLAVLHFSKTFHHIKLVQIIVHPKDIDTLNQSKELSQIVAL
jgi:hypothetical protein